ncbi:unnamed protein product [Enterobius vermicularis]|uniref:MFS domain-containing protein n=1 Tax=Enterobius vermicularis TaxID=51028 RepID=A0A0N4V567_ENTVE|nr:unnamed protein product [Enterobius vermicularis]
MTSGWPYLMELDQEADVRFFGWIMAGYSLGQMISCWLFGWWSQVTASTRYPAIFGLLLAAGGNVLYGLLPALPYNRKWYMLVARLFTGWGAVFLREYSTGTLSLIRSYCAMASLHKDRSRVVAIASACFTIGIAAGPSIQALFLPFGKTGIKLFSIHINMFTAPAFALVIVCVVGMVVLATCFKEDYVAMVSDEEKKNSFVIVPKFDRVAAYTCIYMCFIVQTIETALEVLSTPFGVSLYNWTTEQAIFYYGVVHTCSSTIDVINYGILSFTRIRKMDMRRLLLFGISCFTIYELLLLPWPFYDGPLDYIKLAPNSTVEDPSYSGGCFQVYRWCSQTTRVPIYIYLVGSVIVLGFGFPFHFTPTGVIFSEVLGPRKQGMMQGIFAFFGSSARCITPLYQTYLFKHSGYLWPNLICLSLLLIGITLLLSFWSRLIPLRMVPKLGVATRYKGGVFYHL